jgi:putative ABC transport system permease protein
VTRGVREGLSPRGWQRLALFVLVFCCVLAATAGPREALATRTQAVRQTLAATSPLAQAIVASSTWNDITSDLSPTGNGPGGGNLTAAQLGEITGQLHGDFDHGVVRLTPAGTDWAAMTSGGIDVTSSLPAVGGTAVKLQITCRQPFTRYMRLIAGHYPAPAAASPASSQAVVPLLQVLVSPQTARRFGLHPGSTVRIAGPQIAVSGNLAAITLQVTGIVAPRDPSSTFWTADPTAITPGLQAPFNRAPYWVGEVFAGPGEINAVQQDFGPQGLALQWELPLAFGSLGGQQAQPLLAALNRLSAQSPALTGDVAGASSALQVTSGLVQPLTAFLSAAQAVDTLLWLLYVSLVVAGLVVLLLAARMIALRRSAELTVRRARGASLPQIAAITARGAAVACVPAAIGAMVLAVLLVPAPGPGAGPGPAAVAGGWWPPAVVLLIAVCAPAAVAAWQQRLPRPSGGRRRRRSGPRRVAEATAVAAAVAGIVVYRQQGTRPGSGVNLYTSAVPVLVAVPAVIVVLRVYPLVVRGLLRGSARRAGATAFLGLARAARTALTPALPAFALVLALSAAAFAGMVRDAVTRGEVAASWQAAGADATISASGQLSPDLVPDAVLTPAALRAAAAVPGVTHAAAVWLATWTAPSGQQLTGLAVDPASYAALVAATQTFPRVPARLLATGSPQPVLASPQAAADLGHGAVALTTQATAARPLRVRVAGELSGTPALPGGGAFVVMPLAAIHAQGAPVQVNELLLTGADIDSARLSAVVRAMVPGGAATFRSDILNGLTTAPLQHGAFVLFTLAIIAAAGLGLAVMLLELALGTAEREATLARLATMGLGDGQRVRVVVLEVLPAVIAAAVAALACALFLPRVVAPAVDLSAFTGSAAAVPLTPDVAAVILPLAALLAVAVAALAIEIVAGRRRRGVTASLRAGD